jgi:hypothetical protein
MSDRHTSNELPAGFREYEDGKHRRYELLFKVNGAAFVIAGLFTNKDTKEIIQGVFSVRALAFGMAIFTIIMGVDIFSFGWNMKQLDARYGKRVLPVLGAVTPLTKGLFKPVGMLVLLGIVAITALGWSLVAENGLPSSH